MRNVLAEFAPTLTEEQIGGFATPDSTGVLVAQWEEQDGSLLIAPMALIAIRYSPT